MSALIRPSVQIIGVVMTLLGIAGFVQGSAVLVFQVDTILSSLYLGTGLIGLYAAMNSKERFFLLLVGILYAAIAIAGFSDSGNIFGLTSVNDEGNYLHTAVAVVGILVGTSKKR